MGRDMRVPSKVQLSNVALTIWFVFITLLVLYHRVENPLDFSFDGRECHVLGPVRLGFVILSLRRTIDSGGMG